MTAAVVNLWFPKASRIARIEKELLDYGFLKPAQVEALDCEFRIQGISRDYLSPHDRRRYLDRLYAAAGLDREARAALVELGELF